MRGKCLVPIASLGRLVSSVLHAHYISQCCHQVPLDHWVPFTTGQALERLLCNIGYKIIKVNMLLLQLHLPSALSIPKNVSRRIQALSTEYNALL